MKKRIIIVVEDDSEDLKIIKDMFNIPNLNDIHIDSFRKSISIYPKSDDDFKNLINNVKFLHSARENIVEDAQTYFNELIGKLDPVALILDYELDTAYNGNNAINLIKKLKINIPIVIYTFYGAEKYDEIKSEIERNFTNKKIVLFQKRDRQIVTKQKAKAFLDVVMKLLDSNPKSQLEEPKFDDL